MILQIFLQELSALKAIIVPLDRFGEYTFVAMGLAKNTCKASTEIVEKFAPGGHLLGMRGGTAVHVSLLIVRNTRLFIPQVSGKDPL